MEGLLARAKDAKRRVQLEAELDVPPLPRSLTYLWNRFTRLSNRRGSNGFGLSLLTFAEIDAFQRLTGFTFTPWEIEMIEMLDHLYVSEHAKARESDAG